MNEQHMVTNKNPSFHCFNTKVNRPDNDVVVVCRMKIWEKAVDFFLVNRRKYLENIFR